MVTPIVDLNAEETAQLRALRLAVSLNPAALDNVLAELVLFRKIEPEIKRLKYLRYAAPVAALLKRLPRRASIKGGNHEQAAGPETQP